MSQAIRHIMITLIVLAGCEPVGRPRPEMFSPEDSQYKLAVLIDMSGSFAELMADDGRAYAFLLELVDRYFQDRIGFQDHIIVAQISNRQPALIWEGTPLELRQEFDPPSFAAFLRDHSDPIASPVHQAIAETLEYVMADASVAADQVKPICFVLSDMVDTFPKTPEMKKRILRDLHSYGQLDGAFCIYFCDQTLVGIWNQVLQKAGIGRVRIESGIAANPVVPSFE